MFAALVSSAQGVTIVSYWSFDDDFTADVGGSSFDLTPVNGATAGVSPGRFGNAASFDRAEEQYAFTGGDVISGADVSFSYSAWFNFSLEEITGSSRYFVLETTIGPEPGGSQAWTASLGLRNSGGEDIVQFFTSPSEGFAETTYPANEWVNAIVTYDAIGGTDPDTGIMRAYINGSLVDTYDNVETTTAVGGMVIGGHRDGTGRNFEGLIDDVAFFDGVLSSAQISDLQTMSVMQVIPEPASASLFLGIVGLSCLYVLRRRRA